MSATGGLFGRGHCCTACLCELDPGLVLGKALLGREGQVLSRQRPVVSEALVVRNEVDVELEAARPEGAHHGVKGGCGDVGLPAGDHGLSGSEPLSQLALGEAGSPTGFSDELAASHAKNIAELRLSHGNAVGRPDPAPSAPAPDPGGPARAGVGALFDIGEVALSQRSHAAGDELMFARRA